MATNEQLIAAMRKAASEGNMEAAQRLAQIYRQKNPKTDSSLGTALSTSVDNFQGVVGKGIEAAGRAAGFDGVAQFGSEMAARNEQEAAEANYVSPYQGSLYSYVGTKDFLPALGRKMAENATSLVAAPAGALTGAVAAAYGAPVWATFAIAGGTTAATGLAGAGEAANEMEDKTGAYDPKKAVGIGLVIGFLDRFGAGKVIPEGKLANMSTEEVVAELADKGFVEAAAALANRTTKAAVGEGATEVGQEAAIIGGAATEGAEYTAPEVGERLFDAGAMGTAGGGSVRGATEVAQGVGNVINPKARGNNNEAAADFARDIAAKAKSDGYNLKNVNVNDPKGARAALDALHVDYTGQLNDLIAALRPKLRSDIMDEAQTRLDKVSSKIGFRKAKTKTKAEADKADYEAVERLVGDTAEGQTILRLMRKLDELTTLHNKGYTGGVSQLTDVLNPLNSAGNYNAARNMTRGIVAVATPTAAVATQGVSLYPQLGAYIAGRGIDALTGRRARVAKFVRDNQRRAGQPIKARPSFIEQQQEDVRAAEAARQREEARRRFEQEQREAEKARQEEALRSGNRAVAGASPNEDSPQGVAENGTGLSTEGLIQALAIVRQDQNPEIAKAARELERSISEGGKVNDKMLSPLIKALELAVRNNPDLHRFVVREPDNNLRAEKYRELGIVPQGQEPSPTGDLDPNEGLTAAQRRGKAANIAFLKTLQSQLAGDTAVDPRVKEAINLTLEHYADTNMGQDPVKFITDDMKSLIKYLTESNVDQSAAETPVNFYIGKYLDRVKKQQAANKPAPAPEPTPEPTPAPAPEPQQPLNPEPRKPILEDPKGEGDDQYRSRSGEDQPQGVTGTSLPEPTGADNDRAKKAEKAIFEVGKEGSKYENGLSTEEAGRTIAEALGFKFVEYKTLEELRKAQPQIFRSNPNSMTYGQVKLDERLVWYYTGDKNKNGTENTRTLLKTLGTVFHEVGHAMDLRNSPTTFVRNDPASYIKVLGRKRIRQRNSTFTEALYEILPKTKYELTGIGAEIREFQKSRVSSGSEALQSLDYGGRSGMVRPDLGAPQPVLDSDGGRERLRGYLSDPEELVADALMGYLMNPKQFRQKYPETAKFVREATNKDKELRKIVKFYSVTPLLAVGAILASLVAGEDDEEDTGVLSAPRGALSA